MDASRFQLGVLAIFSALGIAGSAMADKPVPPRSHKQESPDKAFVFVMLSPSTVERDAGHWIEPLASEIREIRRRYTQSGLYRNDGSTDPLWTVDWYAHSVDVASDGIHLVRHGPWPMSLDDEAVSFFANGQLIRSYKIKELVNLPFLLPHSVSHFEWVDSEGFDDRELKYSVTTKDGNRFLFDVQTGEIISASGLARLALPIVATMLACAFLAGIYWYLRRRRKVRRAASIADAVAH
jgi:hypothetical protein